MPKTFDMFLRLRSIIIVLACVGVGIAPQLLWGQSHYRLAEAYADRDDAEKDSVYYGYALRNASSSQVAGIASDYADFLLRKGNYHKAELMLRQALSQSPHDEPLIKTLARCLILQDKVIEGMRYYKSVGSEVEAKEEIAAIYRELGDAGMVAAVEQRWGTEQPKDVIQKPVHIAVATKPLPPMLLVPKQPAAAMLAKSAPQPVLSARYTSSPVVVPRPRKHYIINTSTAADLDTLFPVKPVVATVPAQ